MNLPPPKACRLIRKLHALLGSSKEKEAAQAHRKIIALLAEHGLTWNDLPEILAADMEPPSPPAPADAPTINVLDLVLVLIEQHITITADERLAVALWILHTHVFNKFSHTPRLALLSPVRGCGKTNLLILLEALVARPYRSDNVTAAAIYHEVRYRPSTLLLDEGDNLGLLGNPALRSVFNSGHRRGGAISRFIDGRSQKFSTFAPLAVAAIGTLPLPFLHRALLVNMQRHSRGESRRQPDEFDRALVESRIEIEKWAATAVLERDPETPLHNRPADNWRVLLAIADDLGHGDAARVAAIALNRNRPDEDSGVVLLDDIRKVFSTLRTDRISTAALVEALHGLDDGMWAEWRGRDDVGIGHPLTRAEMAALLRPFGIRAHTIWPEHRRPGDKSARGFLRGDFERAWAAYCPAADTATQSSKIRYLGRS
jgi:hypothetical protein